MMSQVVFEIVLIVLLLLLNGVFAMSEIAVVSARKARLQKRAEDGSSAARRALELAEEPNRFLATVQVGITLVGILAGAFGGATIAEHLAAVFERYAVLARYADALALGVVVLAITYLSLVVGELVPKRIGLNAPETIASAVAGPMRALSVIASPLVTFLTWSTEAVVRLLRVRKPEEPPVTEAEIAVLLEQGTQAGVFQEAEQDLVERVFWLADQRVASLMTPRTRVEWLDVADDPEAHRVAMLEHPHHHFPVCEGSLDDVVGIVDVRDLWAATARGVPADARSVMRPPLFVPQSVPALRLLEEFRKTGEEVALAVDEYGGTAGLVTLYDLMEEIVGDIAVVGGEAEPSVVRRDDGSLLVDGAILMDELREVLDLPERRADERYEYRTLGGFVYTRLGRVPHAGDHFDSDGFRVEVVDMDGNRVDKVLVSPLLRRDGGAAGDGEDDG
ncbi:MAG TPA: hemolysin family protein [Longimicrobium sp.]|nr:hemolysin family protein [Longimicrobium sp.]